MAALPRARRRRRTSSGDVTRFSTASTTPSSVRTAMAVEPSCRQGVGGAVKASRASGGGRRRRRPKQVQGGRRTLMASMAYSTWNRRPSGLHGGGKQGCEAPAAMIVCCQGRLPHLKVFTPLSYSLRVRNMALRGALEAQGLLKNCDGRVGRLHACWAIGQAVRPMPCSERRLWRPGCCVRLARLAPGGSPNPRGLPPRPAALFP